MPQMCMRKVHPAQCACQLAPCTPSIFDQPHLSSRQHLSSTHAASTTIALNAYTAIQYSRTALGHTYRHHPHVYRCPHHYHHTNTLHAPTYPNPLLPPPHPPPPSLRPPGPKTNYTPSPSILRLLRLVADLAQPLRSPSRRGMALHMFCIHVCRVQHTRHRRR